MNLNEIINNINQYNIHLLWYNIQTSQCNLCQSIVQKVYNGSLILPAIITTYQENYYICKYLFIHNMKINLIILKLINNYVNIYQSIMFKLRKILLYPLIILIFVIIFIVIIYFIFDIYVHIWLLLLIFIICGGYLYYILNNLYKQLKFIILLNVFALFLKNIYDINDFIHIYQLVYNKQLNVEKTYNLQSLSEYVFNIHISSYEHCNNIINTYLQQLQYNCELLPNQILNIFIVLISIILIDILYNIYFYITHFVY